MQLNVTQCNVCAYYAIVCATQMISYVDECEVWLGCRKKEQTIAMSAL